MSGCIAFLIEIGILKIWLACDNQSDIFSLRWLWSPWHIEVLNILLFKNHSCRNNWNETVKIEGLIRLESFRAHVVWSKLPHSMWLRNSRLSSWPSILLFRQWAFRQKVWGNSSTSGRQSRISIGGYCELAELFWTYRASEITVPKWKAENGALQNKNGWKTHFKYTGYATVIKLEYNTFTLFFVLL